MLMNLGTGRWAGILAVLTSNLFSLMSCHPFFRCQLLNVVRNPKDLNNELTISMSAYTQGNNLNHREHCERRKCKEKSNGN